MKHSYIMTALLLFFLASCNVEPEPINYNYDECAYCKMKISDTRFGAEMVTSKGKIHKYDSAECLARTYIENEKKDYAFILVTDYSQPNNLIDASTVTFLISKNQPSPMGGNLSVYEDKALAESILSEKGGKLLTFEGLVKEYIEIYQ